MEAVLLALGVSVLKLITPATPAGLRTLVTVVIPIISLRLFRLRAPSLVLGPSLPLALSLRRLLPRVQAALLMEWGHSPFFLSYRSVAYSLPRA